MIHKGVNARWRGGSRELKETDNNKTPQYESDVICMLPRGIFGTEVTHSPPVEKADIEAYNVLSVRPTTLVPR